LEIKQDYKPSRREVLTNNGTPGTIDESQYQSFKRDGKVIEEEGKTPIVNIFKEKNEERKESRIFTRRGQAKTFIESQPLHYDRASLWWKWSKIEKY